MISWIRDVMTPVGQPSMSAPRHSCRRRSYETRRRARGRKRTKRVPQDQCQLGDLLSLLAELEEGGLARVLVEQVGDVAHGAAVVFRDGLQVAILGVGGGQGAGGIVRARDAAIVLLLGSRGGGGGGGGLLGVVLMRGRLRVHPGRRGLGRVLVVTVQVRVLHHVVCCCPWARSAQSIGGEERSSQGSAYCFAFCEQEKRRES